MDEYKAQFLSLKGQKHTKLGQH